jgi:hypothetical protein
MKEQGSAADEQFDRWLRLDAKKYCFHQTIPRTAQMKTAAQFCPRQRSYLAKYPGQIGKDLRNLTVEVLGRLAAGEARRA